MLDEKQILTLKDKFPEPEKLVHAVNVGSHNEAIKQANSVVNAKSYQGTSPTPMSQDELLALLLTQVDEEIVLVDNNYEWTTIKDWAIRFPKVNPLEAGWELEGDQLYRPKLARSGVR
jgi:hypothetical protein